MPPEENWKYWSSSSTSTPPPKLPEPTHMQRLRELHVKSEKLRSDMVSRQNFEGAAKVRDAMLLIREAIAIEADE